MNQICILDMNMLGMNESDMYTGHEHVRHE